MRGKKLKEIEDGRIHCVLFFFEGLRYTELEFQAIKEIQQYSNVIPIIAKGDNLDHEELADMKHGIMKEARH
eukprot:CAMPEP_0168608256 /NCGR_PEP_ID=MMETSP0449_2-20121227/526_1 /TAXON_ID=1082188 /ORGANISM="Strombidium rassoulzadegani, Strain ras09" /LENGTH=71 /DNA_ID=CAMNT_0008648221 /DNA_START=614 /DNA_END=829 /DNA_ORIENTATION=-